MKIKTNTIWNAGDPKEELKEQLDQFAKDKKAEHICLFGKGSWESYDQWTKDIATSHKVDSEPKKEKKR